MVLTIISLILGICGCVLGTIALIKMPSVAVLNIKDVPFITIKDKTIDVDGKIEATDGFYQK